MSEKKSGTMVHRTLPGDGVVIETLEGMIEVYIGAVRGKVVKLAVRAPLSMKISAVHMNPTRGPKPQG